MATLEYERSKIESMRCTSSRIYDGGYNCKKAIDGNTETDWATHNQGVGAWIQLDFRGIYLLNEIQIRQRGTGAGSAEMFMGIEIEFSDGSTVSSRLQDNLA